MSETNAIDPASAKRFVGEIEKCFEELASEQGSYMLRCKGIRGRIKDWKDAANEAGIPRRALNIELKRRDLERKIEAVTDGAEEEDVDLADQILEALGGMADLPLGQAAVDAAGGKTPKANGRARKKNGEASAEANGGGDALNSLVSGDGPDDADVRPRHVLEAEAARVAENAAAIESGIKPLAH